MTEQSAISKEAERKLRKARRSGARLAAVQALYQMEQSGQSGRSVINDFLEDRLGLNDEGEPIEEADPDVFKDIVNGVVDHQHAINAAIIKRLVEGWRLERIDSTSRAILRAGVYELMKRPELAQQIILDEYVTIAHAFFEGMEPKFINGLLDSVADDVRGSSDQG
ncbi:MAG: transcription antitermination factor NusB [Hirschia sp.]|nr:transcription antitermination factor NusB [Hirschia sp.]MBF19901.1 transcription antitermination factor NusB [Hirschia sp.]|tara:strand:+ start:743 stop:1240 length:498 start_codon:yes stop_codon:yes gene_type:complete